MDKQENGSGNVRLNDRLGDLSPIEKAWVWIMRENRTRKRIEIRKQTQIGRLKMTFHWRSKKNPMGRFGGGWNWELGFQVGSRTTIVNLLVCSLRFDVVA